MPTGKYIVMGACTVALLLAAGTLAALAQDEPGTPAARGPGELEAERDTPPRGPRGEFFRGQRGGGGQGPPFAHGAEPRELLEQVMIARLSTALALDDAQTVLLVRRYMALRQEIAALRRDRAEAERSLRAALEGDASEERVAEGLQALQAIDEALLEARRRGFDAIADGLTTWQEARLYLFFSDFENNVRRWLSEVQSRVRERRGAGPEHRGAGPDRNRPADAGPGPGASEGEPPAP